VVEQNKVLMQLPHVPTWGTIEVRISSQESYVRNSLSPPPGAIGLYVVQRRGLHKVLEHDPIRNMLARRDLDRSDFACQHGVCMHVVRMCGFFDPRRRYTARARDIRIATGRFQRWLASNMRAPDSPMDSEAPQLASDRDAHRPILLSV